MRDVDGKIIYVIIITTMSDTKSKIIPTDIMEKRIERVRRKKKGFSKLPALDNIYEPEIAVISDPEPEPELKDPAIVSHFIPMPEPIIEGMNGGPDTNELKLGIKNEWNKISKLVRSNGRYADIFYDIELLLEAARIQIEKTINHMAGKANDTTAEKEFYKEMEPTVSRDIYSTEEERTSYLKIAWDVIKNNSESKRKYEDRAAKNNKDSSNLGKKTKNDSKVIVEVLRFYIMTIIGLLMSYNVLYTWITKKGKVDADSTAGTPGPETQGGVPDGIPGMPGIPGGIPGMPGIPGIPGGMPGIPGGMPGAASGFSPFKVFRPIYDVPWTALKGLMGLFKVPGEWISSRFTKTNAYFIIIAFFTTFGMVNLAGTISSGMADSFISMSKGKLEGSVWIYILIVGFWLVDSIRTILDSPATYLSLIAGTILSITYLIIILVNTLVFASIFKIIISMYVVYRLLFLIPIKRDLQTFDAFAEVYTAATPLLDPETKAKLDSHRHQPFSKASFWEYVATSTFLFENFLSFVFLIVSLISTSILGKNLQLPLLKSTLPIGMVVMILSFLKYKYTMLFDPACKDM